MVPNDYWWVALLLACGVAAADDGVDAAETPSSSTTLVYGYVYASYALFAFLVYVAIAALAFPMMRTRTGWPLVALLLLLVFPPGFFVILLYLLILRLCIATAITAEATPPATRATVVVVSAPDLDVPRSVPSQRERAGRV